jgi:carboxypeptidase T
MKKIFWIIILISSCVFGHGDFKKIKLFLSDLNSSSTLAEIGIDHFSRERDGSIIVYISEKEYELILARGIRSEILIDDWYDHYQKSKQQISAETLNKQLTNSSQIYGVENFDFGSMGGYYTLEEVYSNLDFMFSEYPSLITSRASYGTSLESRDLYYVKISDNPNINEDEPEVLYTSLHHAREPQGMMQMIYFMYYLLENYGSNPEVTYLVDNREMYFIPVVNPDGYEENRIKNPNGGGMHRKNMRDNGDGSFGVDLNRNYGPIEYWDSPNGGSSLEPSNNTYRGTAPFSEPETAAMRQFLIDNNIRACLNYHTYSNLLIFPYGALGRETSDSLIFRDHAKDMTQYNNYTYGTDEQTVGYTTRGNSDDYFYDGEVELKGKIFAMTPEVGNGSDGFWPLQERIIPLAEENVFPNLYYAWIVGDFVAPYEISITEQYILPGQLVPLSISFKNKGLENASGVTVSFSSTNDFIDFTQNDLILEDLSSQAEKHYLELTEMLIGEDANAGDTFQISVTTYKNDVPIFVKTHQFRIGLPSPFFSSTSDQFEDLWIETSNVAENWELTNSDYFSEETSITDSPNGDYRANSNLSFQLKESVLIPESSLSFLNFKTKFEIESGWDYGQVLISSDNGNSWKAIGGEYSMPGSGPFQPIEIPVYSGNSSGWVSEEIDLQEFAGKNILIKFQLNSDQFVEEDGWYIDDIKLLTYISGTTSLNIDNNGPDSYHLSNNYPNPFNPTTQIVFKTPEATNAQIVVYNSIGREVEELFNGFLKQGSHKIVFDASNYTSGVYFYSLKTDNFVATKKMLLIK